MNNKQYSEKDVELHSPRKTAHKFEKQYANLSKRTVHSFLKKYTAIKNHEMKNKLSPSKQLKGKAE